MKALLSLQPGDASTLQLLDVADPSESPDQLLVRVRACGVNYPDALNIQDLYQVKQKRPFSPGGELCGVVERVGANVRGFAPGDLVIGRCGTGAMAEKIAIAADRCVKIPADSPVLEAAGLVLTYATAYYALVDRARLQPGETLLVLGAAGRDRSRVGARVVAAASAEARSRDRGARMDTRRSPSKAAEDSPIG
jgi:NADPH2:quinone reductase